MSWCQTGHGKHSDRRCMQITKLSTEQPQSILIKVVNPVKYKKSRFNRITLGQDSSELFVVFSHLLVLTLQEF